MYIKRSFLQHFIISKNWKQSRYPEIRSHLIKLKIIRCVASIKHHTQFKVVL